MTFIFFFCDFYIFLEFFIVSIYYWYKQKHKIECEGPAQQQWGTRPGGRATPPSGQPGPEPQASADRSQHLDSMMGEQAAASRIFPTWTSASVPAQMTSPFRSAISLPIFNFPCKHLCPLKQHN